MALTTSLPKSQNRLDKLNLLQDRASDAWVEHDGIGIINTPTGTGKNFIAFKCLSKAKDLKWISDSDEVWFRAETTTRESTLIEESNKFEQIYGINPIEEFNISFFTYQMKREAPETVKVQILDEIHFIAEKLSEQFNDYKGKIIGLTATTADDIYVDEENLVTKKDILDRIAPVCFRETLANMIDEGILSPFQTWVITHNMDTVNPYKKIRNRMHTELNWYNSKKRMTTNFRLPEFLRRQAGFALARALYNLPSKVMPLKALVEMLIDKGERVIVFGVENELLIEAFGTENLVYAKKKESENQSVIDQFNKGEIDFICSSKKLKHGITLSGITAAVIASYNSKSHNLLQQLGRIIRYQNDKVAKLFVFRTESTNEANWFHNMLKEKDSSQRTVRHLDLNIQGYISTNQILHKYENR